MMMFLLIHTMHYFINLGTLNPCHVLNGGCEDICTVAVDGRVVCSCSPGRVLLPDGTRCTGRFHFSIFCESTFL